MNPNDAMKPMTNFDFTKWSDNPVTVDPCIRAFCIGLNDSFSDSSKLLKPYAIKTLNTDKGLLLTVKRAKLCADFADTMAEYAAKYAESAEYAAESAAYAAKYAKYAKYDAESARSAARAAEYAAYAEYAARSAAEYAAKYAESAEYAAKYAAESAAESAVKSAEYAKYAAEYAAEYAEYATESSMLFQKCLAFIDTMINAN